MGHISETNRSDLALLGGPKAVTAPVGVGPALAIDEEEVRVIVAAVDKAGSGDQLTLAALSGAGPVKELEGQFRSYLSVRYALAVSSGTAALHTALAACGVKRGQEVVLSPYDWGAGVAAVMAVGATPVFADIDPLTYTLDPSSVSSRIGPRTAAILVTHIFGHPAEMERLTKIARSRGLRLIEDCAQALGATYRGQAVGTFGDVGCFSLGRGKLVSGGEGGILVANSDDIFEAAVRFSQHPVRQEREGIDANYFSLNYRIHPLAALMASTQMGQLERRLTERQEGAERLGAALQDAPGLRPVVVSQGCTHSFHRYSPSYVASEWSGLPRSIVVAALAAEGMSIDEGFIGVPLDLRLRSSVPATRRHRLERCPIAEKRCELEELGIAYPRRNSDYGPWLDQLSNAVRKVHAMRHDLLRAGASCAERRECQAGNSSTASDQRLASAPGASSESTLLEPD